MSALIVKDAPEGLHEWLRTEALLNRRSINQQILSCLDWCMRAYGVLQIRSPYGVWGSDCEHPGNLGYARGQELASRLMALDGLDSLTAAKMKRDARMLRRSKNRSFSYACFD